LSDKIWWAIICIATILVLTLAVGMIVVAEQRANSITSEAHASVCDLHVKMDKLLSKHAKVLSPRDTNMTTAACKFGRRAYE
jgi:hypothetical protein